MSRQPTNSNSSSSSITARVTWGLAGVVLVGGCLGVQEVVAQQQQQQQRVGLEMLLL